jgi:hypothetical protein
MLLLFLLIFLLPQVDRSCHRISQERYGKVTGSCRETREIPETWKQYSRLEFSDDFWTDPAGKHWKFLESIGKFPTGILLPTS